MNKLLITSAVLAVTIFLTGLLAAGGHGWQAYVAGEEAWIVRLLATDDPVAEDVVDVSPTPFAKISITPTGELRLGMKDLELRGRVLGRLGGGTAFAFVDDASDAAMREWLLDRLGADLLELGGDAEPEVVASSVTIACILPERGWWVDAVAVSAQITVRAGGESLTGSWQASLWRAGSDPGDRGVGR